MLEKEKFMKEALKQAKKAYEKGEIPVGAIIVKNNKIIAKENSKWYLIGKDNRKIIKTGYDELIPLTQNNIVRENNSIYLIDEQGNIISEKLVLNKNEIIEKYEDETLQIINEETAKRTKYIYDKESNKFTKTK